MKSLSMNILTIRCKQDLKCITYKRLDKPILDAFGNQNWNIYFILFWIKNYTRTSAENEKKI